MPSRNRNRQAQARCRLLDSVWKRTARRASTFLPQNTSRQGGFSATGAFGIMLRDDTAVGGVLTVGARKKEALLNLGYRKAGQQIVFTIDQMRESLNFDFPGGGERAEMTQNSG